MGLTSDLKFSAHVNRIISHGMKSLEISRKKYIKIHLGIHEVICKQLFDSNYSLLEYTSNV